MYFFFFFFALYLVYVCLNLIIFYYVSPTPERAETLFFPWLSVRPSVCHKIYNLKAIQDSFMELHINTKHHQMTCRPQELLSIHFCRYIPLKFDNAHFVSALLLEFSGNVEEISNIIMCRPCYTRRADHKDCY